INKNPLSRPRPTSFSTKDTNGEILLVKFPKTFPFAADCLDISVTTVAIIYTASSVATMIQIQMQHR
ncbi:MAG: hypothetical protein AAGI44_13900, partial [Pseudomonadota bacterium]